MLQPDDFARLIYLVLLVAFIGFYAMTDFRNRLGQGLQMLAIWVLIFLAAIALYSFRDLVSDGLFTSRPKLGQDGALSISRSGDGHFYLQALANGEQIDFVVDTGATEIVLTLADAERAGIDMAALQFTGEALTANGTVKTARARLDSLFTPGMALKGVTVSVNGGELDVSLLGMAWLDGFRKIEIVGDRMLLHP